MKSLEVQAGSVVSRIFVGESLLNLSQYLPPGKTILITDQKVNRLYGSRFPEGDTIVLKSGEEHKTLDTVADIYQKLIELEADRSSFIVAVGGGVVCDIAGFVASTFMRGLGFGFVATTLLAQVDASLGGKNGVNFQGYKNMVGVFSQPRFVICDLDTLGTLPTKEIKSGLAEIVKYAVIGSADLFNTLESSGWKDLQKDTNLLESIITDSLKIKAGVVRKDEKEKDLRRILNFGHTIGHAVEKTTGLSHGESISIGMAFAAKASVRLGMIKPKRADRVQRLLETLELPVKLDMDTCQIIDAVKKDKKKIRDRLKFVFIENIGHPLVRDIPIKELKEMIHDLC